MRTLVTTIGEAEIYTDYSPEGTPRWVVIWPEEGRSKMYSSLWYTVEQVKDFTRKTL